MRCLAALALVFAAVVLVNLALAVLTERSVAQP
ncbi:hypothetical protein EV192_109190 [Actinocrispum wychmicini]|uniref:Uncharacterized protein n=1 Tax=Actinocrispum wychmicini TaxID=1213861 RepID=A0A4V2S607_9PSEU|nr:hypothetical protein EV192_109190 [Actinocrispum wychmicini]